MRRSSWSGVDCSIAQTLDVVGDPWTLLVVRDAFFGLRRFEDFRRSLGIPRATLSTRLATLVDHGVMTTREYSEQPVRHEYVLTAKGRSLGPILVAMLQWGDEWSAPDGPPVTLVDADSGESLTPVYVDERTGRPLHDLRIERRRRAGTR
jgi:DNA-binding HxlR family transcriptional regulator